MSHPIASHSNVQLKTLFHDIETALKIRLDIILETLSHCHNRCEQDTEAEDVCFQQDSDNSCTSTQIFQIQENQLVHLQEHLERYCNVLPVLGFNSAKRDISFIKSYLLPILVNGRDFEPVVL